MSPLEPEGAFRAGRGRDAGLPPYRLWAGATASRSTPTCWWASRSWREHASRSRWWSTPRARRADRTGARTVGWSRPRGGPGLPRLRGQGPAVREGVRTPRSAVAGTHRSARPTASGVVLLRLHGSKPGGVDNARAVGAH